MLDSYSKILAGIAALVFGFLFIHPFFLFVRYRFQVWSRSRSGIKMPKVIWFIPQGIPWFRKMKQATIQHDLPRTMERIKSESGVMTAYQQVPGRFVVWTTDPENVKALLATQFKDFGLGDRHGQFFPLLGDGIFTLDGAGWSHSRAMLRPQFSREQISHLHSIEPHVQKVIAILNDHPDTYTDIQDLFFGLTIDTATEFLFGESVCSLSGGNPKIARSGDFSQAFTQSQEMLSARTRAQGFYPIVTSKQFKEDCRVCHSFTDSFVQLALERTKDKSNEKASSYIFLDELAKETRDPLILRNQALNILLAGRDTTASLLSFVFYQLALRPEIYFKLRTEILAAFGDTIESLSFESLKRCSYLRNVINETLRLFPTVPANGRTALHDTTLPHGGGPDESSPIFIPKGTQVAYTVYAVHRQREFWGNDANEFRPDRWTEKRPNSHPWDFLPFNGGPRICLGQQFALTEASYTIVRILQNFESISAPEGLFKEDPPLLATLTMCVGGGVPVKLVRAR